MYVASWQECRADIIGQQSFILWVHRVEQSAIICSASDCLTASYNPTF